MRNDMSLLQFKTPEVRPAHRTRTGCLICRSRKKKCDEKHPQCTGCYRNRLHCEWETTVQRNMPRRRIRRNFSEKPLAGQAQGMVNVFTILKPDTTSRLLRHFLDASPRWLSTRSGPRRTDYYAWLLPALSDSPLVLNCVLTIASADLLKYERADPELHHVAVEYYGQAVSGLRTAIETEMTGNIATDDYNPLAVLLLCLHETQNFTCSERIIPHLNAAIFLLQRRVSSESENVALRGFIFEMFCYFFALTAYSLGSKLLLRLANEIFHSPSVIRFLQSGHIMGTSQHLFVTIFRASALTQSLITADEGESAFIQRELCSMDQSLATSTVSLSGTKDTDFECLSDTVTSELYRLACRIYLRKILSPSISDNDPAIQVLLVEFVDALDRLPPDSPSNNILGWPLVVTGLCATLSAHQRIISTKLAHIHDKWRSDIFSKGAAFLREKWRNDRNDNFRLSSALLPRTNGIINSIPSWDQMIWYKLPVILA